MSAGGVAFFDGNKAPSPQMLEQMNFIDAIQGKAELVNTAERGAVVTQILEAIQKSAESGAPVYFS